MVGKEKALAIVKKAIAYSTADQTEASLFVNQSALTRFAENTIHQNVSEKNARLSIRVVLGKKLGFANTNDLGEESIKKAVETAIEIAKLQKDNPKFVSLPGKPEEDYPEVNSFYEATANCSPEERAKGVKVIFDAAKEKGFEASGAFSTGYAEMAIANSLGVEAYRKSSSASISTVVMSDNSAGYAAASDGDVTKLDIEKVARTATNKCDQSQNAVAIEPGEYEVVLEPAAVASLGGFLSRAFNSLGYIEGRSPLSGKMGHKILGDNITIVEDPFNDVGSPMPFDFEGVPKQTVTLVENGKLVGMVYDSYTANMVENQKSTGHSMPAPYNTAFGAMPSAVVLQPGDATVEDMIKNTKKGILITRFHYVNMVSPMRTIITGMTRDGSFLIEDGEIVGPVKNMRFTQSVIEALNNVDMIGKDLERMGGGGVPALKIRKFNFTGTTEH